MVDRFNDDFCDFKGLYTVCVPPVVSKFKSLDEHGEHFKNRIEKPKKKDGEDASGPVKMLGINGKSKLTSNQGNVGKQTGIVNGQTCSIAGFWYAGIKGEVDTLD